jgi:hypothetical protein
MLKVPLTRENHCNPVFVRSSDYLIILDRAARLNYRTDARRSGDFNISQAKTESLF